MSTSRGGRSTDYNDYHEGKAAFAMPCFPCGVLDGFSFSGCLRGEFVFTLRRED
jgi:hypothetical protein